MSALVGFAGRLLAIDETALVGARGDEVRRRVFDTLAAAVIGCSTPEAVVLSDFAGSIDAAPGLTGDARLTCRFIVGAARATEVDDIDVRSCTTVGSVVVPVALAAAAAHVAPGRDAPAAALTAIAAGYEAMARLGRAIDGATLIYRGLWPTLTTAGFAAAAVAGSLLGLDRDRLAHALGIALQQTTYPSRAALARPAYRPFVLGEAALGGWLAALAAAAGVVAEPAALETFLARVALLTGHDALSPSPLDEESDVPATAAVDAKPYPSSRQALASVEAFRSLLPVSPDSIEGIEVAVPAAYRAMVDQPALPAGRIASMIGVQYAMALAATGPESLYDVVRTRLPQSDAIAGWISAISVVDDPGLSQAFPESWGSRVEIRLKSGKRLVADEPAPAGSALQPFGWRELDEKYARIAAASGLSCGRRLRRLLQACRTFGEAESGIQPAALLALVGRAHWPPVAASPQDGSR